MFEVSSGAANSTITGLNMTATQLQPISTPSHADIVVEDRVRLHGAEIVSHVNYSQLSRVWWSRGLAAIDIAEKLSCFGLARRALAHSKESTPPLSIGR